jgi:hypothetical protein
MRTEAAISRCHADIRRTVARETPVVILHIGAEQTVVLADAPGRMPITRTLAIGSNRTAREHFRHNPPAPIELEQAIAAVEEEVMPLRPLIADGSALYTPDAMVKEMARLAGTDDQALSIDQVEHLFNRLAAVSVGRPAVQESLPLEPMYYAAALLLREFMHHLGLVSIRTCEHG